jgi:hypothetical protein
MLHGPPPWLQNDKLGKRPEQYEREIVDWFAGMIGLTRNENETNEELLWRIKERHVRNIIVEALTED